MTVRFVKEFPLEELKTLIQLMKTGTSKTLTQWQWIDATRTACYALGTLLTREGRARLPIDLSELSPPDGPLHEVVEQLLQEKGQSALRATGVFSENEYTYLVGLCQVFLSESDSWVTPDEADEAEQVSGDQEETLADKVKRAKGELPPKKKKPAVDSPPQEESDEETLDEETSQDG